MKTAKITAERKYVAPTLAERVEALETEVDAELDKIAEKHRPSNVPATTLRRMWEAKAAGNLFQAYLVAVKELGLA
jgi:hypothetical protein